MNRKLTYYYANRDAMNEKKKEARTIEVDEIMEK